MKITVYGVDFKNVSELCKLLGYKNSFAMSFIKQKYGTIEDMVKQRLKLDYDYEIKQKLLTLKNEQQEKSENAMCDPAARAVLQAIYNQTNEDVKSITVASVAAVLKVDASELRKRVDLFLN